MIDQPPLLSDLPDWEPLPIGTIELSSEQMGQAVQISQPIPNAQGQWQTYLNALALFGFKEWLEAWASDLDIDDAHCTLQQPQYASLIDAVANVQIGAFKLCLVTTNSLADTAIEVPKAVIDLPSLIPHFYVLVEVVEEEMTVRVAGYLRYDQLQERELPTNLSWSYALPLAWFNPDPNTLLLDLRCLQPSAISLPTVSIQHRASIAQLESRLEALAPQLRSPLCLLDELLSWDEVATVLTETNLAEWLYQLQDASMPASALRLAQPTLNAGLWLRDRLDAVAQELSWVLLPMLAPATVALRSTVEELTAIAVELQRLGLMIPPEARAAYRDLFLGGVPLRLYAVTWELSPVEAEPEWTLLLVLGAPTSTSIPTGIRLQVQYLTQLLAEQVATEESAAPYLYAQVAGTWEEQFLVTVDFKGSNAVSFSFGFNPNLPPDSQ